MNIIKSFIKLVYLFIKPGLCSFIHPHSYQITIGYKISNNINYVAGFDTGGIKRKTYGLGPFFIPTANLLDGAQYEYNRFLDCKSHYLLT